MKMQPVTQNFFKSMTALIFALVFVHFYIPFHPYWGRFDYIHIDEIKMMIKKIKCQIKDLKDDSALIIRNL